MHVGKVGELGDVAALGACVPGAQKWHVHPCSSAVASHVQFIPALAGTSTTTQNKRVSKISQ